MNAQNSSPTQALVVAHDLAKTFDVSAPWLVRAIERKPRQLLKAVDGVSFEIDQYQMNKHANGYSKTVCYGPWKAGLRDQKNLQG